jgi:hypothetical protein
MPRQDAPSTCKRAGIGYLAVAILAAACTGTILDPDHDGTGSGTTAPPSSATQQLIGRSGMRRLTAAEYDLTLRDLTGDTETQSALVLPEDVRTPFDNDYTNQIASKALIEGAEMLATEAAARVIADPVRRAKVVGCTPNGANDSACFKSFISSFGRRVLRRTLSAAEVDGYAKLQQFAIEKNDFWIGVETVLRAFLQDPQFLYRVEVGTPITGKPGMYRLTPFELATRLSYFIWGSTPSEQLLDLAEAGRLREPSEVRAAAASLLTDTRARKRIARFHAMWLGYEMLPHSPDLAQAMRQESDKLVERVVFEDRGAWQDLLRADETYVDDALATHYGLTPPGSSWPTWVSYGSSGRRGILSHGSFLSNGAKFSDTSPTLRGLAIRTRLFCQTIPDPPPNVATDDPIPKTADALCKYDRYAMHRQGGCADCHNQMDPVGFGLENYDQLGRYRSVEPDEPTCAIEGQGELVGIGTFKGPAELADLMIASGELNHCVVTQLYRFASGRFELDETDALFVDVLTKTIGSGDFKFDELLLEFVSSEAFGFRRDE